MTAVPRAPNGDFLPPQYRLESVPAGEINVGDLVSWNISGRAEVCEVVDRYRLSLVLERAGGSILAAPVDPDTTVNRVEVLW